MPSIRIPLLVEYRKAAQRLLHRNGTLEIDNYAVVQHGEAGKPGAYVQAWVWVSDEDVTDADR